MIYPGVALNVEPYRGGSIARPVPERIDARPWGDDVTVQTGAIVFAGAQVGYRTLIGAGAIIHDNATIGDDCVIGSGVIVGADALIGDRVKINSGAVIIGRSIVRDDVFIGPGVLFCNDPDVSEYKWDADRIEAPIVGRRARIYTGAILMPGSTIGEDAVVAAGSLVRGHVQSGTTVMGRPARAA